MTTVPNAAKDPKRVVTPAGTLSYPALWEPRAMEEGKEPDYSAVVVFPTGTDLSALKAAVVAAGTAKWGDKFPALFKSGALRNPIRRNSEKENAKPPFDNPDGFFITARSKQQPYLRDEQVQEFMDRKELYAGCQVRLSVSAYAYDKAGNKGIAFALNAVQKVGDGKRLDGRRAPEEEFAPVGGGKAPADTAGVDNLFD